MDDAETVPLAIVAPPAVALPAVHAAKREKPPYAPIFGNLAGYAFSRFVALGIDLTFVPASFACFLFNAADRGTLAFAPRTLAGFTSISLLAFAAAIAFAMLAETALETTLGKAIFGLGVRRSTGGHAGVQRIAIRYAFLPLDLLALGEISALVTRRHQRLGDLCAGTVVARHRAGAFATAFAFATLAGLLYAQATIGGGLSAIVLVATESTYYVPTLVRGALADVGLVPHADVPPPAR